MLNVEEYISSGIVESYVLGITDEQEAIEFEHFLPLYPQLRSAMRLFETELENKMLASAVPPPAYVRSALQKRIKPEKFGGETYNGGGSGRDKDTVIPILSASNDHIRVHKNFRYAFIVLVILSKIFLYLAIFYYLHYKDELRQKERLEHQMNPSASGR